MRIGFIGLTGHQYLSQFLREEGAQVEPALAADGHNTASITDLAARWNISRIYDDPAAMLDDFKPDIASVGAIYGYNGDVTAMALERGIPTISDKPIAATWDQLDRLQELTAKHAVPLVTEFPFRSEPAFVAAHDAVAQGLIGEVVLATGQKSYAFGDKRPAWYANRKDYGGTILWVASHAIDFIRYVTGKRYTRVYGRHGNITKTSYEQMEEYTVSVLNMEGGGTAIVHADYNRPKKATGHGDDRLRVVGGSGILEIRDRQCVLVTHEQEPTVINERAKVRPVHHEMLAALRGETSERYGTRQSLEMAAVLLHARDAADKEITIDL